MVRKKLCSFGASDPEYLPGRIKAKRVGGKCLFGHKSLQRVSNLHKKKEKLLLFGTFSLLVGGK